MNLTLCREDGLYHPREMLAACWRISRVPLERVQGLEVSVMWYTEGKGDEDFHVHHFHRQGENQIRRSGLSDTRSTHCKLPATPLSYRGKLISVRWCVRLRLFLANGREIVTEQPFYLIHPTMVSRTEIPAQNLADSAVSDNQLSLQSEPEMSKRSRQRIARNPSGPSSAT
ncbi:MAG: hypothetical protein P8L85_10780 [Rubripirellula sp.]|nr:hypothetical protein [Rubripirellula sp.]